MRRTSFADHACPIARTLEVVGEWWSLLVVREAFLGVRRFDALQERLGIARNVLSTRLATLVEKGVLARRRYQERPPRDEYVLTAKGRALFPVILTLKQWGEREEQVLGPTLVDRTTGRPIDPVLVDRTTGAEIAPESVVAQGRDPAAPEAPAHALAATDGPARAPRGSGRAPSRREGPRRSGSARGS